MSSDKAERYRDLCLLSAQVRELVGVDYDTINAAIIDKFYKKNGHEVFKKFNEWKAEGKKIVKGSKGFAVWSRPLYKLQQERGESSEEEVNTNFAICYLFSNKQVV